MNNRFRMKGISSIVYMAKRNSHGMFTYASAIEALNGLQSNAQYLRNRKLDPIKLTQQQKYDSTIGETIKYLKRVGITSDQLDSLPAIHVTGTKGKGSTCAVAECILRMHGLRTGFYSSPHLVEVRERIRIDGAPIDRDLFARYFWEVYGQLQAQKSDPLDMPAYFRFLTVLAARIFLSEGVHVALMEVGIGGEYDCTNAVLQSPRAVACITPIAYDHMALLGDTLGAIAWHKAGVMKRGGVAWSAPQRAEVRAVLEARSKEKGCTLNYYETKEKTVEDQSDIVNLNVGLGIKVVETWLEHYHKKYGGRKITLQEDLIRDAVSSCFWPGRYQVLHSKNITYYLDGAHTAESISICTNWYLNKTKSSMNKKVLLYNSTGDRNSEEFFQYLAQIKFDKVFFVPNLSKSEVSVESEQIVKCARLKEAWLRVMNDNTLHTKVHDNTAINGHNGVNGNCAHAQTVSVLPNICNALEVLEDGDNYDLLVTGSLHLIGCLLSIVDPELNGIVDKMENANVKEVKL